jgi:hypothetical protein
MKKSVRKVDFFDVVKQIALVSPTAGDRIDLPKRQKQCQQLMKRKTCLHTMILISWIDTQTNGISNTALGSWSASESTKVRES